MNGDLNMTMIRCLPLYDQLFHCPIRCLNQLANPICDSECDEQQLLSVPLALLSNRFVSNDAFQRYRLQPMSQNLHAIALGSRQQALRPIVVPIEIVTVNNQMLCHQTQCLRQIPIPCKKKRFDLFYSLFFLFCIRVK